MSKSLHQKSFRQRLNISRLAIANPWITICFWLAVTVAGLFAFSSLKYALFPNITFPVVVVSARADLANALETEAKLTEPIENQLQALKEVVYEISSKTYPGQAYVTVECQVGSELESSAKKVEDTLKQITFPPGTTYEVKPFNLNESSAITYAIESDDKSIRELVTLARSQILPEIEKLPGILNVNLLGDPSPPAPENNQISTNSPTLVRFNNENAVAFQVIKKGDANTLEVVSQVEAEVEKLQARLPEIKLILAETQAKYIREATQATIEDLILSMILAVTILFPFLRSFAATAISAITIPISLLGTTIVMAIAGFNLETITLLALALVIGIVVDDAIVDVENIARHIERGETPKQAAILGTDEIGLTVVASTLTIVAVFLPVAFLGGTVGKFFKPFGLTISAAVTISLLVARTLSPVLAIELLKQKPNDKRIEQSDRTLAPKSPFLIKYRNLLDWSLRHRAIVVGIAVSSLIVGLALIPLIPQGFIPKLDRGEFNIIYRTSLPKALPSQLSGSVSEPSSAPTPATEQPPTSAPSAKPNSFDWLNSIAQSPDRLFLNRTRRIGSQLEEEVLKSSQVESVFTIAGFQGDPTRGKLYVKLKQDRQFNTAEVQEQIREALPKLSGATVSVEDIKFVDTGDEKPLKIALLGDDLKSLAATAQEIKTRIEKFPGFADVSATEVSKGNESIYEIERKNGRRAAYISANLGQNLAIGEATDRVVEIAKSVLPSGVRLDLEGESAQVGQVMSSFAVTMALSVVCILGVLFLLFGRLLEPIVVGLSLPLSIVGAMLGLLVAQSDFGMISLIGLILLLGLVDKNSILLIDYANQLRGSGWSRTEAILETGTVRLRPILMTTFATILGMLPIALGLGAGAELRQPMAVAIIGGLITSTLLSLIVVPVLYTLLDDLWAKIFKNRRFDT